MEEDYCAELERHCGGETTLSEWELSLNFRSLAKSCYANIATQHRYAESNAISCIIHVLSTLVTEQNRQPDVSFMELLADGLEGVTSMLTTGNLTTTQRLVNKYVNTRLLDVLAKSVTLGSRVAQETLPPITAVGIAVTERETALEPLSRQDAANKLLESSLKLAENLVLHASARERLVSEFDMCAVLVDHLNKAHRGSASVAEHCLTALGNLLLNHAPLNGASMGPRLLQASVCEGTVKVLMRFGCEDVSTADCALFLLQSLAATDPAAVMLFQNMTCLASSSEGDRSSCVVTVPAQALPCDLSVNGVVALLLSVLLAHCETSITVTEAAVGAIGALVLQSPAMMLHLLGNKGLPQLVVAAVKWGPQSAGITGKCLRIFSAAVEMVRLCRNELRRVSSHYEAEAEETGNGEGGGSCVVDSPTCAQREEVSVFDSEDLAEPVREVSVGVPGATPGFLYTVLDQVDVCAVLMDAENGALERERRKGEPAAHKRPAATMASVGSLVSLAMKMKSFKGGGSGKSSKSGTSGAQAAQEDEQAFAGAGASAEAGAGAGAAQCHSQSAPALPRLLAAVKKATTSAGADKGAGGGGGSGVSQHSSSLTNLRAALGKARANHHRPSDASSSSLPSLNSAVLPGLATPPGVRSPELVHRKGKDEAAQPALYEVCVRLLRAHGAASMAVLHPAVRLLLVLADGGAFPHHWVQVSNIDGCAALVAAAQNRGMLLQSGEDAAEGEGEGVDPVFACESALEALLHLAQCNLETRDKLRQLNAHTTVVAFLHHHGLQSLRLCEFGASLFVLLYGDVSAKEANAGNALACRAAVQLLQHHGARSRAFAQAGMGMLRVLTLYTPNRRLLAEKGGCLTLTSLIRDFALSEAGPRDAKCALFGLATLSHLAGLEENQSRLAKNGACRLVAELLRAFGAQHELVAAEGLSAVSALAVGNRAMLGQAGLCEEVAALLRHYSMADGGVNDNIVMVASTAIFNLCADYPENKQRFVDLQVAPDLRRVLGTRQLSYAARAAAKDAVNCVCF